MRKALGTFFYIICIPLVPLVLFESELFGIVEEWRRDRFYKRWRRPGKQPLAPRNEHYEAYDAALRRQFLLVIHLGRTIRKNVGFLWKTGRKYWWHRDRRVSRVARKLCRGCAEAVLRLDHLRAGLELRKQLRRIWLQDHSDLREFWRSHFDSTYGSLEETAKKLASVLLEPDLWEDVEKILAAHRPTFELPMSSVEEARNDLRQLKGTLWLMLPANRERLKHPIFRSIVGWSRDTGNSPHIPIITAFAHGTLRKLSDAEREIETKPMEGLLSQLEIERGSDEGFGKNTSGELGERVVDRMILELKRRRQHRRNGNSSGI